MFIVGHRGARAEAPENTLAGFRYLRSLNIHHVELDIRLSKDKKLVVIHDTKVDRTTTQLGYVRDYEAEQLVKMDATKTFPHWKEASGIPLLDEIIAEWPELKSIQLEVKSPDRSIQNDIADRINFLVQAYRIERKSIVTSSDVKFLKLMQRRHPNIRRGLVAERFNRNPIGMAKRLNCEYLVIDWRRCSEALVMAAQLAGLHVSTWTVNQVDIARKLHGWGVDSLITDVPSTMLSQLRHPLELLG